MPRDGYFSRVIALPDTLLVRTFEHMDYDIQAMSVDGLMSPAISLRDVYYGLMHDPAAVARIRQLLGAPGPRQHAPPERTSMPALAPTSLDAKHRLHGRMQGASVLHCARHFGPIRP